MLELIRQAGIVGGGGAGFPTWKKLDTTADTVILNAAECEPVLETDKYYLRTHPTQVLQGLCMAATQVGAQDIAVVLKDTYWREIEALQAVLAQMKHTVRLVKVRPAYPSGDEHVAVYEATGRVVPPGGIPGMVGAVVVSVSTAWNIYMAVEQSSPVTRRLITISGEVANPCLLNVPVGITVGECIQAAGGARMEDFRILMGGPMMGKLKPREGQLDICITKTDSGILVLPPDHNLIRRGELEEAVIKKRARSACIQCRYCTEQCPRYLLGHRMYPHRVMRALAMGEDPVAARQAGLCSECGICELYACPMGLSPRKINMLTKPALAQAGIVPDKTLVGSQQMMRFARQVPAHRLAERIGVGRYRLTDADTVISLETGRVVLPLRQHIGAPATPVVCPGDTVFAGQQVAVMDEDRLGAPIHASIGGVVESVNETAVVIRSEQRG